MSGCECMQFSWFILYFSFSFIISSVAGPWHFGVDPWSGSADPCLWLMDPDPGSRSCYFRHWPSRCQQKTNLLTQFFLLAYFLKLHLHHFSNIKSQKESQNSRNQGFSNYFCMMIEGSGSGRPKNMWIRWIRIRNTSFLFLKVDSNEKLGQSGRLQWVDISLELTIKGYFHLECAGFLFSGLKYFKSPAAVTLHTLKICRLA